jgi:hypothetical protein
VYGSGSMGQIIIPAGVLEREKLRPIQRPRKAWGVPGCKANVSSTHGRPPSLDRSRVCFEFSAGHAFEVEITDYH